MRAVRKAGEHVAGEKCFLKPLFPTDRDPLEAEQRTEHFEIGMGAEELRGQFLVLGLGLEAEPKKFGRLDNRGMVHGGGSNL
jgi:hypothetical protein